MRRLLKLFSLLIIFMLMWACSGSQSVTDETPQFADQAMQDQVDDLLDKIDDNPAQSEYRRQLAQLYHDNGKSIDALKTLETGLALDPNDVETKYLYAKIADEQGDKKRAYTAYKEVLQSSTGNDYLNRIAPNFIDAFSVKKLIGDSANAAFGDFSADGSKVIFQADYNGNWDLYEMDITSGAVTAITRTPEHEESPAYSADGRYIVYTSTKEDQRNVDHSMKLRDIFIYDRENDRYKNVTQNSSDDWSPKFSQDGKYISFVSERDDLRDTAFDQLKGEVYIMESDGRFQMRLTHNEANDGGASVMPGSNEDKGTVFYDSDQNGKFEIYKTDFKGEKQVQVTFNPQSNDVSPIVSPNGDRVLFFSDRDGNYEVYIMNSDGSAQMRLTSNPADDLNPTFSPDGNKVLFHSNRGGKYAIYVLDLSQQNETPALYDVIGNIDNALNSL